LSRMTHQLSPNSAPTKMRIVHVLNHTNRLNGHVHAAVDLACAQSASGHKVAVVSGGGDFDALLAANDVETICIDQRRHPLVALTAIAALTRLMRRFDVAHAHMMTSAILCFPASKITGVPLVTTVHNEFERSAVAMGVGKRVIAVSGAVARSMERRGIPASRLRVVLNGTIGTLRYGKPPGPPLVLGSPSILSVGGLHPRKGIPDLLKAFEIVAAAIPGARLHIVGEGPCKAEYRKMAAAMPCASAITFHGGQDDPRPWFQGADVFVLASHAEPAGLVLSEACEAGCAIVASNVDGIPEMLDGGKAGVLIPPRSPTMLAEALIKLLTTPNALMDAKYCAIANTQRMSLDRVTKQTLDVYWECLAC
jgi:glycosyltransferase involved in cell wall biosynthesis